MPLSNASDIHDEKVDELETGGRKTTPMTPVVGAKKVCIDVFFKNWASQWYSKNITLPKEI